jgi:predicted ribosome quality control (RQC) complex YloA/Tae2 family protein
MVVEPDAGRASHLRGDGVPDRLRGASYQTLINQALREYIVDKTEPLEDKIRRMVREEVAKYGETLEPTAEELPLTEE